MTALLVAAALSFTLPRFHAGADGCTPDSASPIFAALTVDVYAQRQPETWGILALNTTDDLWWQVFWPTVRAEAEPRVIRSKTYAARPPGAIYPRDTLAVPAGPWLGAWLRTRNESGATSCPSNRVRP